MLPYIILGLFILAIVIIALNVKVVPQSKAYVVERLGAYQGTWQTAQACWITLVQRLWSTPTLPKTGY